MNLYQREHSISEEHFIIERKRDFTFPIHLHRCFEFICILSGQMEITVDGNTQILKPHDCAFIFPNQAHSLRSAMHSEHILYIFSPEYIGIFNKFTENRFPSSNFFTIQDTAMIHLITSLSKEDSVFRTKGILYSICGIYADQCTFLNKEKYKSPYNSVFKNVLEYAEENYRSDCSLKKLTDHLGYNYSYISKLFSCTAGMSFNSYVNYLRINQACFLLTETADSILDIALACGYDALRSFNRNFRKLKGISPKEYRKSAIHPPLSGV